MRLLVFVAFAVISVAFAPSRSDAASLDLTGAIGAAIAVGNADSAVYSGNAAFGAVTVTANPAGSDLTFVAGSGLGVDCAGGGIACRLDNPNQVDTGEILKISFDQSLLVTSVDLRNLKGTNLGIGSFTIHIDEGGAVVGSNSVPGSGFDIAFSSTDAGADGSLTLAVNRWATSISFVPNGGFFDAFSVAGISIAGGPGTLPPAPSNPIPEPSSVLLMLVGGGLVATQLRKHV